MGIMHKMKATGEHTVQTVEAMLDTPETQAYIGGYMEYVYVLYNGKKCLMIVNEEGAIHKRDRGPLPINARATKIYKAAAAARGHSYFGPPFIHGDVLLYEGVPIG